MIQKTPLGKSASKMSLQSKKYSWELYQDDSFEDYVHYVRFKHPNPKLKELLVGMFYIPLRDKATFDTFHNFIEKKEYTNAIQFCNQQKSKHVETMKIQVEQFAKEMKLVALETKSIPMLIDMYLLYNDYEESFHCLQFLMFEEFASQKEFENLYRSFQSKPMNFQYTKYNHDAVRI
jgi:hypothetical protein